MSCNAFEKLLQQSFEGLLIHEEREQLESHLKQCRACQQKQKEYRAIFSVLQNEQAAFPKPQSFLWERLRPELQKKRPPGLFQLWKTWGLRAIPLSLLLVTIFGTAILLLIPHPKDEMSQSELLLLQNLNPLQETQSILEEGSVEEKNMRLIFTTMDDRISTRRYTP